MGHYANHLGKKKVAFDELLLIAERVLAMPGMVKLFDAEDDAPDLNFPFVDSIVPPADLKGLIIHDINIYERFNPAKISVKDLYAEAIAVMRECATLSPVPFVVVSIGGILPTDEGKSRGKFEVALPDIWSREIRLGWDDVTANTAQAVWNSVTGTVGLGQCRVVGEALEYTDDVAVVPARHSESVGWWISIPYPEPAGFDPAGVVEGFHRAGIKIKSVTLSSSIISPARERPSHEDFRELWLSMARNIKSRGKGSVSLVVHLESLDSVEIIRSALRGRKSYLVTLGQMPTSPGYWMNFNVRVHPDGYTFEIRSKDDIPEILKQVEAITGVPFQEDADV